MPRRKPVPQPLPKSTRSGSDSTYEARVARGMPNCTFTLPTAIDEAINALKDRLGSNRSRVVVEAIRALAKREGIEINDKP